MRTIAIATATLAFSIAVAHCSSPSSPTEPSPTATVAEAPPAPTPVPDFAETARYRLVFESTWSATSHPIDFPATAHYSRLIGSTHTSAVAFWEEGRLATEGIRRMAERGAIAPLDSEVAGAIAAGTAQFLLTGPALGTSPGSVTMEFEATRDFPLVTLVTMVAPSPDWFVGVSGLPLLADGVWIDEVDVTLYPHDAGTDSGVSYAAPDRETTPRRSIARLEGYPVGPSGAVAPFGRYRFTRLP